jgi:hypothetical protein
MHSLLRTREQLPGYVDQGQHKVHHTVGAKVRNAVKLIEMEKPVMFLLQGRAKWGHGDIIAGMQYKSHCIA